MLVGNLTVEENTKEEQLNTRLATNVHQDNQIQNDAKVVVYPNESYSDKKNQVVSKLETKVNQYNEIQTNEKTISEIATQVNYESNTNINTVTNNLVKVSKIQTLNDEEMLNIEIENQEIATNIVHKMPKRIATLISSAKIINNMSNRMIKTGKSINTGLNEGGLKSFENSSSRIMTKPVKKVAKKVTSKATNKLAKTTKKAIKKKEKNILKKATNLIDKVTKIATQIVNKAIEVILAILPSISPIIIIILIIICFCTYFGMGMSDDTRNKYEQYMISIQDTYDNETISFYNEGNIVDGAVEGKGFINWRAPMAIIQCLNGNLEFDSAEQDLLNNFKKAELYEKVVTETYTEEQQVEVVDKKGNVTTKTETVTKTKKIVTNPTLNDYITWVSNNFGIINQYKKRKGLEINSGQTAFTESEIEQIKMLYQSTAFFELFSENFQTRYAYSAVSIDNEQLQAIYDEFLRNAGKRYLMDHSNLSYDTCMSYYDCSSWTIHCLAHTGIKVIPNTTASGLYNNHCTPINPNDRQGGDLIFLKDTYNTGTPGGISHVGIYMGTFSVNGETAEWIIDTGGNPSGVKISKYQNGWWNGSHFYGFGRLR